ncbi:MAG: hypothetical protein RR902_00070 [Oscillospiraceae bacterium]
MEKGKLGIKVWLWAALAFIIAYASGIVWSVVLLAFLLIAEKNDWLTRQAIEAVLMAVVFFAISTVLSLITSVNGTPSFVYDIVSYVRMPITLIEVLFVVIAVIKVKRGEAANLPFIGSLADKILNITKETVSATKETVTAVKNTVADNK